MPSKVLPSRPSLAHLKYQAGDLLALLKKNSPDAITRIREFHPKFKRRHFAPDHVSLSDAQLVIAREYGFDSWPKLKQVVEKTRAIPVRRSQLEDYEKVAADLITAFDSAEPAALDSVWKHFGHRRTWPVMRQYVLLDLGRRDDPTSSEVRISIEEARTLVARELGFETWTALARYFAQLPDSKILIAAKPIRLFKTNKSGATKAVSAREWETTFDLIQQNQFSGLRAQGQMTDAIAEELSRSDRLASLDLNGSVGFTDVGARFISRMSRIECLDLSGTAITDRGLEWLGELQFLKSIKLTWTAVTDRGISHLSKCNALEKVILSGTRTGDGAIRALAGKPRLRHLMTGGAVTDLGIPLLHEFPVFKQWAGGESSMSLLSPEAGPNYLSLRGPFTNKGISQLSGLNGLFALNLDDSKLAITGASLAHIVNLPNLGWLAFDAKDDAMPFIAAMPNLRFLMCQDTSATDGGFEVLSKSGTIEYLWARRCHGLRARGFKALSMMPALRAFSGSCKNVDDHALACFRDFPALVELMPMDVPDAGYRHVVKCQNLNSLVLMYCRDTSDLATLHIRTLPRLRKYFASYTQITDRSLELLSEMNSLEEVTFHGCAGVSNHGVALLARLPRLAKIEVSGPKITSGLAAAFPKHVSVQVGE